MLIVLFVCGWRLNEDFRELWKRISRKTRHSVAFDTATLITKAAKRLADSEKLAAPRISMQTAALTLTRGSAETTLRVARQDAPATYKNYTVPDLIAYTSQATELTRSTISQILVAS